MSILDLISVIVPIYKVEAYLDRCIQSISAQTYANLEIILVDDGSPDNCPAICDKWAKLDRRIKVIHKKNGGLSDARNCGLESANGNFIGFVDSDDYISPDMFQLLYEDLVCSGSDISACGVDLVFDDGSPNITLTASGKYTFNTKEAMNALISETSLKQPVWYKLYKKETIKGLHFPIGKCHEDVFWSYLAIGNAKRISVFDTPCYHYFQRTNSIMGSEYSLSRLDVLEAKLYRQNYVKNNFPELSDTAELNLLFSCIYSMQMSLLHLSSSDFQTARSKILDIVSEIKPLQIIKSTTKKQRVWVFLAALNFEKTCKLRNWMKIGF